MSAMVENTGAYLAGRFAGKMAATVEKNGELEFERRVRDRALKEMQGEIDAEMAHKVRLAVVAGKNMCVAAGNSALIHAWNAEAAAIAAHIASRGSISAADFARIAPLTAERPREKKDRILSAAVCKAAAFENVEKLDFSDFCVVPEGMRAVKARIRELLEEIYA